MTVLKSAFDPVVLSRTPSWSHKGMIFKRYHRPSAAGQYLAQAQLAESAYNHYGARGFIGGLPVISAYVRADTSGRNTVPGGAAAGIARAREQRHAATPGIIRALRAKAGAGGGAGGPVGGFPELP